MIKAKLGDRIDGWLHTAAPFLFRREIDPNHLTVAGALVSLLAAAMFPPGWFVAGGVLILCGGVFDLIDGVVARHHGTSTRFGAFLDSTLDRVVDMALLLGLLLHYSLQGRQGVVLLAGVALIATVLVSYAQAKAEPVVPDFRIGLFERGERIALLALGALTGWMVAALWLVAVGSALTVAQRFWLAHREMQRLDSAERIARSVQEVD